MLAEIVAAALISAAPTPTPTLTSTPAGVPTAAPAGPPTTPLREVVYRVSTLEKIDDITESFGGGPDAVPPSSTAVAEGHGTVTVDVLAKFERGILGIGISEQWKERPLPLHFIGAVAADGTVEFAHSTIDASTIELLPYFAISFAPDAGLSLGSHWTVENVNGKASMTTDYTVTAVGVDSVTIQRESKIRALGGETITGTIEYEPSLLVAKSGRVRVRRTDMYVDGQTTRTIDISFDRISDTFVPPSKP
jgi:hypothetical protein